MIEFRPITNENFRTCIELSPGEVGKKFVAENVISIAQAYVAMTQKTCIPMPYAIYNDETMVGFMMMSFIRADQDEDIDEDIYEIWRFMIDENQQGKGYGKASLMKAIELIKTYPHGKADKIYLSYVPGNETGSGLYKSVGFVETGDMDRGEVVMVYDLKNN